VALLNGTGPADLVVLCSGTTPPYQNVPSTTVVEIIVYPAQDDAPFFNFTARRVVYDKSFAKTTSFGTTSFTALTLGQFKPESQLTGTEYGPVQIAFSTKNKIYFVEVTTAGTGQYVNAYMVGWCRLTLSSLR